MAGLNIVALEEAPQVPETSICAAYYDSWRARKLLNKLSSLSCGRVLGPKGTIEFFGRALAGTLAGCNQGLIWA
jgi:hypothetical protein